MKTTLIDDVQEAAKRIGESGDREFSRRLFDRLPRLRELLNPPRKLRAILDGQCRCKECAGCAARAFFAELQWACGPLDPASPPPPEETR